MRSYLWSAVALLVVGWMVGEVQAEHTWHRGGYANRSRSGSGPYHGQTYNYRDWSHHRDHGGGQAYRYPHRIPQVPHCPPVYVPPLPPRGGCHVPPPVCHPSYPPYPYGGYPRNGVTFSGRNFSFGIDF